MESGKFPKAIFKGNIADQSKVDFNKDGTYEVNITGTLTIHGVGQEVSVPGSFEIKNGQIRGNSYIRYIRC